MVLPCKFRGLREHNSGKLLRGNNRKQYHREVCRIIGWIVHYTFQREHRDKLWWGVRVDNAVNQWHNRGDGYYGGVDCFAVKG